MIMTLRIHGVHLRHHSRVIGMLVLIIVRRRLLLMLVRVLRIWVRHVLVGNAWWGRGTIQVLTAAFFIAKQRWNPLRLTWRRVLVTVMLGAAAVLTLRVGVGVFFLVMLVIVLVVPWSWWVRIRLVIVAQAVRRNAPQSRVSESVSTALLMRRWNCDRNVVVIIFWFWIWEIFALKFR